MPLAVTEQVRSWISVIVIIIVGISLGGYMITAAANSTIPLVSAEILGIVFGAGLLLLAVGSLL